VSLTFDDGSVYEYAGFDILRSHRMNGTFLHQHRAGGLLGYYMTWSQVEALAAAGNEIAGHTLHTRQPHRASPAKERFGGV
jgi:hypothetical protein